jgi:hypothetical protein
VGRINRKKQSELYNRLFAPTQDYGVEEDDLYEKLGEDLCGKLFIRSGDKPEMVRNKLICHIERLIAKVVKDEDEKVLVRTYYNINADIPKVDRAEIGTRLGRLQQNPDYSPRWSPDCERSTLNDHMNKIVQKFEVSLRDDPPSREELAELMQQRFAIEIPKPEDSHPAGLAPSTTEPAPPASKPSSRLFKKPVITFTATTVVVAAIAVAAFYILRDPNDQNLPNTAPGLVNTDCTPSRPGIAITCMTPPALKSIDNLSLKWEGAVSYLFAGRLSSLPRPPQFAAYEANGHCDEWANWFSQQKRIYTMLPSFMMDVSSSSGETVIVKRIESQIYRYAELGEERSLITCQYGAGTNPGHLVTVDTATRVTTWLDLSTEKTTTIPPTTLQMKGEGEFAGVMVQIESKWGRLYEGTILVTMEVNGQERQLRLGTPKNPFRWLGGTRAPNEPDLTAGDPAYDWSPSKKQWVKAGTNLN